MRIETLSVDHISDIEAMLLQYPKFTGSVRCRLFNPMDWNFLSVQDHFVVLSSDDTIYFIEGEFVTLEEFNKYVHENNFKEKLEDILNGN